MQSFVFLAVYAAIVTAAELYSPWALRILAGIALLATALDRWRARPSYGRARGLPPGSLAIAPIGPWVDQADYLKRAARYGPVFKMNNFLQPMVCVVGLKSGADLLRSHDGDLSVPPLPFERYVPGGFIRYMPADEHRPLAARLRAAISDAVIRDREPAMARIAASEVQQLAKDSTANGAGIPPRPYLDRTVFAMFAEVFFAIDHQSGRLGALRRCYSMIHYSRAWKTSPRRVEQNLRQIEALVRAGGSVGRGRSFLSELSRGEPTSNLDNNTLRNLIYLLLIASTDVTGLMHWAHLILDPDRFLGERAPASSEYSPLGMSRIACLGEQLTLTIGRNPPHNARQSLRPHPNRRRPARIRRISLAAQLQIPLPPHSPPRSGDREHDGQLR